MLVTDCTIRVDHAFKEVNGNLLHVTCKIDALYFIAKTIR